MHRPIHILSPFLSIPSLSLSHNKNRTRQNRTEHDTAWIGMTWHTWRGLTWHIIQYRTVHYTGLQYYNTIQRISLNVHPAGTVWYIYILPYVYRYIHIVIHIWYMYIIYCVCVFTCICMINNNMYTSIEGIVSGTLYCRQQKVSKLCSAACLSKTKLNTSDRHHIPSPCLGALLIDRWNSWAAPVIAKLTSHSRQQHHMCFA